MKCTMCDGTGQEKVYDKLTNTYIFIKCAYCNGSGKLSQTNDEWRKTCSAEEFALFLSDVMWYGEQCATEGVLCENCKCPWCEGIINWLKQPHTPQKQDDYPCNVKGCSLETRQACCGCPDYFKWKERQESR